MIVCSDQGSLKIEEWTDRDGNLRKTKKVLVRAELDACCTCESFTTADATGFVVCDSSIVCEFPRFRGYCGECICSWTVIFVRGLLIPLPRIGLVEREMP